MSYSPIEDRYLSTLTQQEFPDAPPAEPSIDGMQLAEVGATKMADYGYSGQRQATMTDYDPTVRERMADFLQAGFEKFGMDRYKARQNAQTLIGGPSSNLPLNTGLADIVPFLGTALQTQEAARMGEESITSAQQGNYGTAAMQAGGAVVGMIPGVAGTVKAGKALAPKAGEMVLDSMNKLGSPVQMNMMPDAPAMAAKPAAPVNDMGFYSAVEQAALNIQRKSGTGQAMLNDITKGDSVKADEVKWLGLDDFLKGKKNVTREEVQEFVAANKVDIKEVTLTDAPKAEADIKLRQELEAMSNDELADNAQMYDFNNPTFREDAINRIIEDRNAYFEGNASDDFRGGTKYSRYQLPGGENYREILLTTPTNMGSYNEYAKSLRAKYGDGGFANMPLTEVERARLDKFYANEDTQAYKSSHWEQPNVLAHIRVNDRVDADGKKMLLVEEVQSDWHQTGRDKGYGDGGVPDAPMKDTWYQLALKRVLKYAADNGYERVGLTTGARQAERYDLSKDVDAVSYHPDDRGRGMMLNVFGKNNDVIYSKLTPEDKVAKVIGKDAAKKLLAQEPVEDNRVLQGIDLKVGGEGMKKYYDEVYPEFLAKYGKKWGAKVGETKIQADGEEPVRFVDITPEMRQSVGKGQPLFSATATGAGAGSATMQDKEKK